MASISISIIISSNAYASAIQDKTVQFGDVKNPVTGEWATTEGAKTIFAASCATCHGGKGQGGVTFIKNMPSDKRTAPSLLKKPVTLTKTMVRNGSWNGAMPAFGPQEITDDELDSLAQLLFASTTEVPAPTVPTPGGGEIRLDILDADPWYSDHGDDLLDTSNDVRRVALDAGDYLKVVNTGRTWHTFTDSANAVATEGGPKDSGFIGYAGNYIDAFPDLNQGQTAGIGYYYATQATVPGDPAANQLAGLKTGCYRYLCKLHPYMQVEVCTEGSLPAAPTTPLGLTRAHKHRLGTPTVGGVGKIWVSAQSQEDTTETETGTVSSANSVTDMDGAYQVINTAIVNWPVTPIANVGNNPHNAWPGKNAAGDDVVLSANWHDNTVTLMQANFPYAILGERRSGAATAHIQVSPGATTERFYVTHMGGAALQEIDVNKLALGQDPNIGGAIKGNTAPHGLWFCGDGVHVLTADTLGNSATLYNTTLRTSATPAGSGGRAPLAPAIFSGVGDGCSRGFTNNALTADISVYDINIGAETITRNTPTSPVPWTPIPAAGLYQNAAGNIQLRNITDDQVASPFGVTESINQARWVHLPVQTPVSPAVNPSASPAEVLTHGRYMVTANKASFNVSVTKLDSVTGDPIATYSFPAGLGAHGVTYGKKSVCANPNSVVGGNTCYYAYVTNTFEDYVSVYDLEMIETTPNAGADGLWGTHDPGEIGMGPKGSALIAETVYVEGGAIAALLALDPGIPTTCGAFYPVPTGDGTPGVLTCGAGTTAGSYYASNVPIGVLCPDCRSGVHVGDIPLTLTTGDDLATCNGGACPPLNPGLVLTETGTDSKYTYLKEEVWIDTMTTACIVDALDALNGDTSGTNPLFNDCDNVPYEDPTLWTPAGAGCTYRDVNSNGTYTAGIDIWEFPCDLNPATGPAGAGPLKESEIGNLNQKVELDLSLGINTGGQGIFVTPAATPWP